MQSTTDRELNTSRCYRARVAKRDLIPSNAPPFLGRHMVASGCTRCDERKKNQTSVAFKLHHRKTKMQKWRFKNVKLLRQKRRREESERKKSHPSRVTFYTASVTNRMEKKKSNEICWRVRQRKKTQNKTKRTPSNSRKGICMAINRAHCESFASE